MKISNTQLQQTYTSLQTTTQPTTDLTTRQSPFAGIQDSVDISSAALQSRGDGLPLPPVTEPIDV